RVVTVDAAGIGKVGVTWTKDTLGFANLSLTVTGPSPSTATVTGSPAGPSSSGSLNSSQFIFPAAGTYTVSVSNASATNRATGAVITTTRPRVVSPSFTLQVKQGATVVPATVVSGNPTTVTATVGQGNYTLVATPSGAGTTSITGTFPNTRID